ncbi:hypothetical protein SESBI_34178 [Sesbania bispinosa]|nr:hypothetical protein SESBI_34178 [Sesbania bispinosa]
MDRHESLLCGVVLVSLRRRLPTSSRSGTFTAPPSPPCNAAVEGDFTNNALKNSTWMWSRSASLRRWLSTSLRSGTVTTPPSPPCNAAVEGYFANNAVKNSTWMRSRSASLRRRPPTSLRPSTFFFLGCLKAHVEQSFDGLLERGARLVEEWRR